MIKFINILTSVISEQKRYQFSPETQERLKSVVDKLWNDRNKKYVKKTRVDFFPFKLADGTDGLVKVIVNPRLPYIGFMGTNPKKSLDPADIFIEVNPKHYQSKKNLYLTIYHEMIHASDPTQSHEWKPSYEVTYNPKKDEEYWGHPIEFFAITNEFLEGLVNEYTRRVNRARNPENKSLMLKSFNNILDYFSKGEKLSKLSQDVLYRINDEYVNSDKISNMLADISTDYPNVSELIPNKEEIPYYLHYIQLIKKYNPDIWKRFLTMLFKTKDEIENIINKKRG
jgi:hypothetical protein